MCKAAQIIQSWKKLMKIFWVHVETMQTLVSWKIWVQLEPLSYDDAVVHNTTKSPQHNKIATTQFIGLISLCCGLFPLVVLISLCCGLFPLCCANFIVLWLVSFGCANFVVLWLVSFGCANFIVLWLVSFGCANFVVLWLVSVVLC